MNDETMEKFFSRSCNELSDDLAGANTEEEMKCIVISFIREHYYEIERLLEIEDFPVQ